MLIKSFSFLETKLLMEKLYLHETVENDLHALSFLVNYTEI